MKSKFAQFAFLAVWLGAALSSAAVSAADGEADGDFTIGPSYTNAPELTAREGVPRGALRTFTMQSEDSKFYPGIAKDRPGMVPYRRRVCVYIPQRYVAGTPAPFMVVQDGLGYTNRLPIVLDNLIHEHRLPVMLAVMVNSGGGDGKGSERGLEYDTVSGKYAEFIENEVLPRVARDYHVAFTKDPEGRATMGCS